MKTKRKRGGKPRFSTARREKKGFRHLETDDERHGERVDTTQGLMLLKKDVDDYKSLMRYCMAFSNNDVIMDGEMEMLIKYYREMKNTIMTYVNPENGNLDVHHLTILESLQRTAMRIVDETEGKGITTLNFCFYDMYDDIPDDEQMGISIIRTFIYLSDRLLLTDEKSVEKKANKDRNLFKELTSDLELTDKDKSSIENNRKRMKKSNKKWNTISDVFYYYLSKSSPDVKKSRKKTPSKISKRKLGSRGSPPPLPRGWLEKRDPINGRPIYVYTSVKGDAITYKRPKSHPLTYPPPESSSSRGTETDEVTQQAPHEEEEDSNDTEGSTGIDPDWRRSYSVPTSLSQRFRSAVSLPRSPTEDDDDLPPPTPVNPHPEDENDPPGLFQRLLGSQKKDSPRKKTEKKSDKKKKRKPTPVNPQPEDENDSAGWFQRFLGSRKKEDSPRKKTKKKNKKKSSKKKPRKLPESTTIFY